MTGEKKLSSGSALFLIVIGIFADGAKLLLDLLFGIGIVLDPLLITPITTLIFWITLHHNNISMFGGKLAAASWTNEAVSLIPGIDALPDWTAYAIYLAIWNR